MNGYFVIYASASLLLLLLTVLSIVINIYNFDPSFHDIDESYLLINDMNEFWDLVEKIETVSQLVLLQLRIAKSLRMNNRMQNVLKTLGEPDV